MITIYHNPLCSKSRGALEHAQQFAAQHAITLSIVDYQKTALTLAQLQALHQTLQSEGSVAVRDMVRDGEDAFALLQLEHADDDALFAALAAIPSYCSDPSSPSVAAASSRARRNWPSISCACKRRSRVGPALRPAPADRLPALPPPLGCGRPA